jgi:8-oxo-dGTP diphosphatase
MSDLRTAIYALVEEIDPLDILEKQHQTITFRWIASGAELFRLTKPAIPPIHLVSYFIVIDPERDKLLLVDHIKAELWLPTGGHVEPDEHPRDTVIREVKEELGIGADFLCDTPLFLTITQTSGKSAGHTDISLWYALKGCCLNELKFDREEFYAIQWFQPDQIPKNSDRHLKRFIEKWSKRVIRA